MQLHIPTLSNTNWPDGSSCAATRRDAPAYAPAMPPTSSASHTVPGTRMMWAIPASMAASEPSAWTPPHVVKNGYVGRAPGPLLFERLHNDLLNQKNVVEKAPSRKIQRTPTLGRIRLWPSRDFLANRSNDFAQTAAFACPSGGLPDGAILTVAINRCRSLMLYTEGRPNYPTLPFVEPR